MINKKLSDVSEWFDKYSKIETISIRFNIQTKDRFSEAIISKRIIFAQTMTYKTIETVKTIYEYSGGLYVNGKITNYVYDRVQK